MANIALAVDWPTIRAIAENGVHFDKIAAKYGVKKDTITKRAERQGWLIPKVVQKVQSLECPNVQEMSKSDIPDGPKDVQSAAVALIQETWAEKGESYRRMIADKIVPILKAAKLPEPKNWKDAEIADKMARKALGLESGDNQVNLAILPGGWLGLETENRHFGGSSVSTFDADTDEPPSPTLEDGEGDVGS